MKLTASANQELINKLKATDISVPKRTEGRTSEHTERYSICHFLATLAKTEWLHYPLHLKKREKPDFLLICNNQEIGIEVTEATSTEYSSFLALAEHEGPNNWIEPSHFLHGKKLSLKEKRELLDKDKLISDGWAGNGAEKECILFIQDAITRKCKKLQQPDFSKFDKNWLLIYDNTPTICLKKELLLPFLNQLSSNSYTSYFDQIFIEISWIEKNAQTAKPYLVNLSRNDFQYFSINDLWRNDS